MQYPHQWNWDSAFTSLGLSHLDWRRAATEIESLLEAQWIDGMVPHIRYDPANLDGYFPGPARWPRAQGRARTSGVLTSGISNPPIAVTAALWVGLRQPDLILRRRFWEAVYPGLERWLRYFRERRTVGGSPLITVVHPWESGWDNSPRWDFLRGLELSPRDPGPRRDREHVVPAQRPEDRDYGAYLALVELLEESDYDLGRFLEVSPFAVYDVLLNAIWYRAARDLGEMAAALGRPEPFGTQDLDTFRVHFEGTLWEPSLSTYVDFDIQRGRRIPVLTPAGLAASMSGLIRPERVALMWDTYLSRGLGLRPIWTADPQSAYFDPVRYWRGPVWVIVNWMVLEGLKTVGLRARAAVLARETLRLIEEAGFAEYYDPRTGNACGATAFSFTAALAIQLVSARNGEETIGVGQP